MNHPRARRLGLVLVLLLLATALPAQTPARRTAPPPAATLPAIFLSDIHLDPYADPAKLPQLLAAPASAWPAILAAPDSPTRAADFASLVATCSQRGVDTDDHLWQSSLGAIQAHSRGARFATVTGDLLAHSFDCKFRTLAPDRSPAEYVAFAAKTVQYIVSGLRTALPGVPIYFTLGNNDTGCADYHLDPSGDAFLAAVAPILAQTLPDTLSPADRQTALADLASSGRYSAPLPAPFANTRIVSLDDIFASTHYANCVGQPGPAAAAAQLQWLDAQLSQARAQHQRVWFLSHIPPGVDLYASARRLLLACSASSVRPFLNSDSLATSLVLNSDVVPLAVFGHTHSDEVRFLSPEDLLSPTSAAAHPIRGVPIKVVPSISPINGNLPAFLIGRVSPATAVLVDYTVVMASDPSGTAWKPEYTYSARFHKAAFDSASVRSVIGQLHADRAMATAASQAYAGSYTAGVPTPLLQLAWPPYTCSLAHTTVKSFTACACAQ